MVLPIARDTSAKRRAFTLIELLLVVVIIGVLAAIAIPRYDDTKRKAHIAAMKTDLKNAATAAEAHFVDQETYVGFPAPTTSVNATLSVTNVTGTGYTITAASTRYPGRSCTIGGGSGVPTGLREGEPGGATCK
jgi:prepilin-type N-terminal cleavage/methylation domain-containing protein